MAIALVTGASSGMGLEYARQLAEAGYDLVLVSNQEAELAAAGESLGARYGVQAICRCQDLAKPSSADELYAWCESSGLEVEVLVNDAGMFFFKELTPADEGRVEAMMHLHMTTVTKLCLLFGCRMQERGHGHIVNMSSMAARLPVPGITIYSATKAYLKSFGRSLWYEMKPYGVSVTTVCPAAIATPLYKLKPSLMNLGIKVGVIKTPQWLVRRALRAMRHGRRVIAPGFMNVWLPAIIAILPTHAVNSLWAKWKR